MKRGEVSRRAFIQAAGCAAAVALAGCATVTVHRKVWANGRIDVHLEDHPVLREPGGRILVGADALEGPVLLLNDGGAFTALFAVCTHLQCTLRPSGDFLQCPCHGSTYNLRGEVRRGPAERPLPHFRTLRQDDGITILIEK